MTTLHSRKSINRSSLPLGVFLIPLVVGFFALLPTAEAVNPPPDGGYANDNTAEGTNALFKLTTGVQNTALGFQALFNNTAGSFNTATGWEALENNTTGSWNTAAGVQALFSNTTGIENTATGSFALFSNTTGNLNTANGVGALGFNTTGSNNTATGHEALDFNTTGNNNTATGSGALERNTTGSNNTANGAFALETNAIGNFNTAIGEGALDLNNSGNNNTAEGFQALLHTKGNSNIALGALAGANLTTGNSNIDIGNSGVAGEGRTIRIGTVKTQTATFIAGIHGVTVASGLDVVVGTNGQLGTITSSARFKEAIKPMDKASEAILSLQPVTFRYKHELDPDGVPQFGLIAEQVEKVNPDLVVLDEDGKVNTVRYEAVNAMLLNEFLKEHRKVEEQQATIGELKSAIAEHEKLKTTIAQQQKQIEVLTATVQKVSDQIAINKSAPQLVANP